MKIIMTKRDKMRAEKIITDFRDGETNLGEAIHQITDWHEGCKFLDEKGQIKRGIGK